MRARAHLRPSRCALPRSFGPGFLAAFALACCAGGASSEPAPESDSSGVRRAEKSPGLEEIIVSGERRDEDLQKVGAAVSSLSSEDLLERGLRNFNTLQFQVPSLFSGGGLTKITLRGVGSEVVGPGVDPGFAVHVNGVFSARETTGTLDYFDVARVDVLRGPQGMLWGRNSTGGAVNVITERAAPETSGGFDIEYGSFHDTLFRGVVNVPLLADRLYARLAFLGNVGRGTLEIDGPGNHQYLNDGGAGALRASLRWEPDEDFTLDLIASYQRFDNNGPGIKFAGPYRTLDPVVDGDGIDRGLDYDGDDADPGDDARPNPRNPYRGTADEPQYQDAEAWTATLIAEWLGKGWKLRSTSGYQQTDYFLHRDQDTSSLPLQVLELTDQSLQLSQEFLLQSEMDAAFEWTLGASYQWDKTPRTRFEITDAQNTAASSRFELLARAEPPFVTEPISLVDGCPPDCPPLKPLGVEQRDFVDADVSVENHVVGLFAFLSYEVWEYLTLSAGARFSYTNRRWKDESLVQSFFGLLERSGRGSGLYVRQVGSNLRQDWEAVTWRFGAEYALAEQHLLWASVSTGERAGGFNFIEEQDFAEERILAFEAGSRSLLFDERLRLSLTSFWYDWRDPQVSQRVDGIDTVVNVPGAVAYGVEAELQAVLGEHLWLNASLGWLEARYDQKLEAADSTRVDFVDGAGSALLPPVEKQVDLDGKRLPRSPRFTAALGAAYEVDLGAFGSLTPRVDFYFRDAITFRQFGNPKDDQASFTRTDLRLVWTSEDRRYWAEVFVRNLEDDAVKTNQEVHNALHRVHYYDPPRNGGFRIGFDYWN